MIFSLLSHDALQQLYITYTHAIRYILIGFKDVGGSLY